MRFFFLLFSFFLLLFYVAVTCNKLVLKKDNKKKKPRPARHVKGRDFIKNEYEDAFFNRVIGFRGELNYLQRAHSFKNTLAGGWFIPYKWAEEPDYTKSAAYVTVLPEINDRYSFLYEVLRKALPEINFFVLRHLEIWQPQ